MSRNLRVIPKRHTAEMNGHKATFWSRHTIRCFLRADAVLALPTEAFDGKSPVYVDGERMD